MQGKSGTTISGSFGIPYWWDGMPVTVRNEAPIPRNVDIVVIGSGFTGLSAALTLARAGRTVVVCDKSGIGEGASTRNGGQIGAKLRRSLASVAAEHGEQKAVAIWGMASAAKEYLENVIFREKIKCDYTKTTRFQGAHRDRDYEQLCRTAEQLRETLGYNLEPIPRSSQFNYVRSEAYNGGVLDRNAASFHPAKFIQGLAETVQNQGVYLSPHNNVNAIKGASGRFEVVAEKGTICTRDVLVATNGYTGSALPQFKRRIVPIGSYMIATDELPVSCIKSLMPGCDLVIDTRRCASYMRVSPNRRRILYGGRVAAVDIGSTRSGPRLKKVLDGIFPELSSAGITHSWMGYTGFPLDELPKVGQLNGIYYAMGYCGSGTAMATYCGNKVAEKILDMPKCKTPLSDIDFKISKAYRGTPWFLSPLIATYRVLDRYGL